MVKKFALAAAAWLASAVLLRLLLLGWTPISLQFASGATNGPQLASPTLLTSVVSNAVVAIGIAICLWYLATATALLLSLGLHGSGAASRQIDQAVRRIGAPFLRRVALWGTITSIALGSSTAAVALPTPESEPWAAPGVMSSSESRNHGSLIDLGWPVVPPSPHQAPTDESPANPAPPTGEGPANPAPTGEGPANPARISATPAAPTSPLAVTPTQVAATHTVQPGDTLWAIAATHLRKHGLLPTPAQINAHWQRWYAENLETIGTDPHIITPGLRLNAPPLEES